MNVLSLFDGMSCGRIALEKANVPVETYYASEIDKYAIQVSQDNYPDTVQLGDVESWKDWNIDWGSIDLLIGGSPCQGFSFAGKQLAFDDPRSALFFVYVDILNHIKKHNPKVKFLLENVKMKKEYLDVITDFLETSPVFINSSCIVPQSRQRWYWSNWDFRAPEPKDVNFSQVMENDANHRYYYTQSGLAWFERQKEKRGKQAKKLNDVSATPALEASMSKGYSNQRYFYVEDVRGWRYLTVLECERLQTVPDGYTKSVSKTQAYRMLGNGWTVDVISHIFSQMEAKDDLGK